MSLLALALAVALLPTASVWLATKATNPSASEETFIVTWKTPAPGVPHEPEALTVPPAVTDTVRPASEQVPVTV